MPHPICADAKTCEREQGRGPVLGAQLALSDRHPRLPDRAGQAETANAPIRDVRSRTGPWGGPGGGRSAGRLLEPIPDALVTPDSADPAVIVAAREGLGLALIASLQHLPPRPRAVLVLRDVLEFPAAAGAVMLGSTTPAIKSALQARPRPAGGAGPGRRPDH
jgi:Sigma-70, region 4